MIVRITMIQIRGIHPPLTAVPSMRPGTDSITMAQARRSPFVFFMGGR
jgi:hypothetical protein